MFCDGAGVVVLKRLAEAVPAGDTIHAVLKGSGKNNNGARPASFLAPSAEGQAEAIAIARHARMWTSKPSGTRGSRHRDASG